MPSAFYNPGPREWNLDPPQETFRPIAWGGRHRAPNLATAGGRQPENLDLALDAAAEVLEGML